MQYTREELEVMKVDDLKRIAREAGIRTQVINCMTKDGLVMAILDFGNTDEEPDVEPNEGIGEDIEDGEATDEATGETTDEAPDAGESEAEWEELESEASTGMTEGEAEAEQIDLDQPSPPPPPPASEDPLAKIIAQAVEGYLKTGDTIDPELITRVIADQVDAAKDSLSQDIEKAVKEAAKKVKHKPIVIEYKPAEDKPLPESLDLGVQHFMFEEVMDSIKAMPPHERNFFLFGPSGSGKNVIVENIAKAYGLPFYTLPVGLSTSKNEILGFNSVHGNYVKTMVRTCYEFGGVILIDEFDAGNPNVMTCTNALLGNGYCGFPDGLVSRHDNCMIFANANTCGRGADIQYVGRLQMDEATRQRFTFLEVPYDEALEEAIAPNKDWFKKVVKIRRAVESLREKLIVSPRATIKGGYLINAGIAEDKVKDRVIYQGISNEVKSRVEAQAA